MSNASIDTKTSPNQIVISTWHLRLLYSYDTLVAAYAGGKYYVTDQDYSATTNKHIAAFVQATKREYKKRDDIKVIPHRELDDMFQLVMLPKNWTNTIAQARYALGRQDDYDPEAIEQLEVLETALLGLALKSEVAA